VAQQKKDYSSLSERELAKQLLDNASSQDLYRETIARNEQHGYGHTTNTESQRRTVEALAEQASKMRNVLHRSK